MIVKSIGAKGSGSFGSLVNYIVRDSVALKDRFGQLVLVRHNLLGNTPKEIIEELIANEARRLHRRSDNNMLLHTILSLSEKDKDLVDPEMLVRLSEEYIKMMDPNCLAIGAIHMADNPHAHVLVSGCNMLGSSTRISTQAMQCIKQELQAIQIRDYPQLEASVVEHGGGHTKQADGEYRIEAAGKSTRKEELRELASVSFELATSRDEFASLLAEEGLGVYQREGRVKGLEDQSRSYQFETLGLDMQELDKREERMREIEDNKSGHEITQEGQERDDGHTSERMSEIEGLGL